MLSDPCPWWFARPRVTDERALFLLRDSLRLPVEFVHTWGIFLGAAEPPHVWVLHEGVQGNARLIDEFLLSSYDKYADELVITDSPPPV